MIAFVYLIISIMIGMEICRLFLAEGEFQKKAGNFLWVFMSASFGIGILSVTWILYLISWMISIYGKADEPLLYGNVAVILVFAVILMFLYGKRFWKNENINIYKEMISDKVLFRKELIFYSLLTVFMSWIMFYMFYISEGKMYSGFTVYGDYAPHTAMIRSFSCGNNFPTQYPHFGGEDVKYHFMFQFLTGNLEYLGLRIDLAYNIISIMSLMTFLILLCQIAQKITGRFAVSVITVLLFLFRSGLAFFQFLAEHIKSGDLLDTLLNNTSFIGYTANENWGLWNFNVYLNQRHLAFGLTIVAIAIWVYIEWVDSGCNDEGKGILWLKRRIFTLEAWKSKNFTVALTLGMMLGLSSFWNGAAVIGGLLILFGMAIFSNGKLDYLVTAVLAVFFSYLQTNIFINGKAMSPAIQFGFLAEEKTIIGVIDYLLQMSGIFFLGIIVIIIFRRKRNKRIVAFSCMVPVLFAFTFSLTPDINVNHKYIMISYAFLTIFWGEVIVKWWQKNRIMKIAAILLAVLLTLTGVYDFVIILKGNDKYHRVQIDTESDLTEWLSENLTKDDLILTPQYSMHEVTMSGAMLYCGWPYYAWSAGYDTYYRAAQATAIYTTTDAEYLKTLIAQEGITYILYEDGMTIEGEIGKEELIAETYTLVYTSENGGIRIYETR